MRSKWLLAVFLIGTSLGWAQSSASQTPATGGQSGSSAGTQTSGAPRSSMRGTEAGQDRKGMHAQHMQAMQNDLAKMRSLLDQMKSNVAGMNAKDRAAMQPNVQLWQMLIDHMGQMTQHMSAMQGQGGMGMMTGSTGSRHMGCCSGMQSGGSCGMQGQTGGHSGMNHGAAAPSPPTTNNPPTPPQR
ncbi:MAG TPA: hypothetical protein VD837_10295 [Terriglobales bacterium]|nr:hypothetical protein [Terriglobales bacterium]